MNEIYQDETTIPDLDALVQDENDDEVSDESDALYDFMPESDELDEDKAPVKKARAGKLRVPRNVKRRGARTDVVGGVYASVYQQMVKHGLTVVARGASVAMKTGVLRHGYKDLQKFIDACRIAANGNADKVGDTAIAAGGAATTIAFSGTTFFGVRVCWNDSFNSADRRPFLLTITHPTGGSNTIELWITPKKCQVELFIILPSSSAGIANITSRTTCTLTVAADKIRAGSVISVESLNKRDLGSN